MTVYILIILESLLVAPTAHLSSNLGIPSSLNISYFHLSIL